MSNILNDDFRDSLAALNDNNVRYVLVGGFPVILHGYSRTTGDMDIWVERTVENYQKLKRAFKPAEWRLTLIVHKVATFIPGSSTNAITRLLALKYCPVVINT